MIAHLFDTGRDRLETLAQIHAMSFPDPWSAASIGDLLTGPGTFAFQLQDGFILSRVAGEEAEILTLAVVPAMRGRGLGRILLATAAQHAQALGAIAMFLEVGVDNPPALALYAGQGFVRVGRRKAYYGGGDALIMKAQLPLSKNSEIA
jgi:ribosomal-protein-alanine N-acetyltransferase